MERGRHPPAPPMKKYCPEKNREKSGILQSHNVLSSRQLQNTLKVVLTET
jgi:hypothetical protein